MRAPGAVYVAMEQRRWEWRLPWPRDAEARLEKLAELVEILDALAGAGRVAFLEDGLLAGQAQRWPWPAPLGLLKAEGGYPDWAFGDGFAENTMSREPPGNPSPAPPDREMVGRAVVAMRMVEQEMREQALPELMTGDRLPAPADRPDRREIYSGECARATLELLREAGRRLTLSEIGEELERRGVRSITTVNRTLPIMRRRGEVTNRSDTRGSGYGLPEWDRETPG